MNRCLAMRKRFVYYIILPQLKTRSLFDIFLHYELCRGRAAECRQVMKIFYAISNHWDREWYKPFQGFRYDLAKVTDRVIDALESGKIKTFTFDGQTVVLEDYLEIRPQKREALKKLIKSGRLKVDPWYVMPDELLVSGESIIRNSLIGKRVAEQFDSKIWKYGYINDIFGHIAQLPQILNGFGINAAYMGRGVGAADQNFKNFIWRAPDELLVSDIRSDMPR